MLKRKQLGFTALEFMVVIIIVGIIATMITFDSEDEVVELRAIAEQIAVDIRYTQSLAMARGERYRVNFFTTNYTFTDLAGTTSVIHPAKNVSQIDLDNGITLSVNAAITNDYVAFNNKGIPFTTATFPGTELSSTGVVTLTRNAESITIQIAPTTGRVVII